jgi:hypothetical protein
MKWVRWLLGVVVVLWLVVGWLGLRVFVPVNPAKPYFLASMNRVSGLEWPLVRFQPVYCTNNQVFTTNIDVSIEPPI